MRFLLFLFILIPITEMWVLIEVGSKIGALSTIFLVFLTAIVGLALLRKQGVDTLLRLNKRIEQGQIPAGEILEGVALAVGGALLLTPGFITDSIGFLCLLPFTRKYLLAKFLHKAVAAMGKAELRGAVFSQNGGFQHNQQTSQTPEAQQTNQSELPPTHSSATIDGEFKRED
ncbi:MAG: UPF0716 protein FxsA [Gammaproteobacteria bacterium]|jgi:UPF0716 protein FxsA